MSRAVRLCEISPLGIDEASLRIDRTTLAPQCLPVHAVSAVLGAAPNLKMAFPRNIAVPAARAAGAAVVDP
jgi:hypothetical protein